METGKKGNIKEGGSFYTPKKESARGTSQIYAVNRFKIGLKNKVGWGEGSGV